MADTIDIGEVSGCTCLRLREVTRRATQLYDEALIPSELTISQFGLLAQLSARDGVSIGALAERAGMDPTTLNRQLKPLEIKGLVRSGATAEDRRVRSVWLTKAGRAKVRQAVPHWRRAQAKIDNLLGADTKVALNSLLNLSSARLKQGVPSA
jgi:DNA-binding MarR family transcriptional regulator